MFRRIVGNHGPFTRYINVETGEYVGEECGICNHASSCGYHYPPREYYRDHPLVGRSLLSRNPLKTVLNANLRVGGTKNIHDYPLNYEGAYAQALYLIQNGYNAKPTREESIAITEHDRDYMSPNDCMEVLRMYYLHPDEEHKVYALTAGDILKDLTDLGFRGKGFNTSEIGKAMKRLEFEARMKHHANIYLVSKVDPTALEKQKEAEGAELMAKELENEPF